MTNCPFPSKVTIPPVLGRTPLYWDICGHIGQMRGRYALRSVMSELSQLCRACELSTSYPQHVDNPVD